jgi:DNA-binding CsgD family transcriptional regulator
MSTQEIARELELSAVTVRRHLATVARKTGDGAARETSIAV